MEVGYALDFEQWRVFLALDALEHCTLRGRDCSAVAEYFDNDAFLLELVFRGWFEDVGSCIESWQTAQ